MSDEREIDELDAARARLYEQLSAALDAEIEEHPGVSRRFATAVADAALAARRERERRTALASRLGVSIASIDVLCALNQGHTRLEVSKMYGISVATVATHLRRIDRAMQKRAGEAAGSSGRKKTSPKPRRATGASRERT